MLLPRKRKKIDINLIPFINVIFLLLIFFMVAGRVEPLDVLDVNLPLAQSKDSLEELPINVFLSRDNQLVVNRDFVELDSLKTVLNTLFLEGDESVVIKVDADASAHSLIDVLDVIRSLGNKDVVIETRSIWE
jgi:biopolymer transport protein ExbD